MKLDLTFLLEHENQTKEAEAFFDLSEITIGSSQVRKLAADPLVLTFYNDEGKKLYVSGSTKVTYQTVCDRCLTETEVCVPVHISEEFEIADDEILYDDEEGVACIEENHLDVDCLVKNEILMNWPSKVLCKEDCKGICPVCGKNRNLEECSCDTFVPDPRMAEALDVFKKFKEV